MKTPAHLVLSAGGVRCLAYVGALECLCEHYEFKSVSACSAGTFVGALLCAGVTPQQMREEVMTRDLEELGGAVTLRPLRTVSRRVFWPYALFGRPGIPDLFEEIAGRSADDPLRMEELRPDLATAAVDVVSERLLAYTSKTHPDMPVREVLKIATAVPGMYPPHENEARSMEVVDAAITSHTPLWLTSGFDDGHRIIVLRTTAPARRPPRSWVLAWLGEVMQGGVSGQDAYALARSARVTVHDIPTDVKAFDFGLSREEKCDLIEAGLYAVRDDIEISQERGRRPSRPEGPVRQRVLREQPPGSAGREGEARVEGAWRQRLHAAESEPEAPATVFISYAREDRRFVERLRFKLGDLVGAEGITVWDDAYIGPGDPWEERIADAVLRARVAVLLVSAHFNASKYIRRTELPMLRKRGEQIEYVWLSLDGKQPEDRLLKKVQAVAHNGLRRPDDSEIDDRLEAAAARVKQVFEAPREAPPPAPTA